MKNRFFTTFFISIAVSSILAGLFFLTLSAGLRKTGKELQGKLNYILKGKEHYDVVFSGSSQVMVQINPVQFDSLTKSNSYNAGVEGARIAELEVFLKKYLDSHGPPEYLFLNVNETSLLTFSVWDFPRILPYVSDPDFFALSKYQPEIALGKYLPPVALTYYNDSRKSLALSGLSGRGPAIAAGKTRGFLPVPFNAVANLPRPAGSVQYIYSKDGLQALKRICTLCGKKKIHLIILIPPHVTGSKTQLINLTGFKQQLQAFTAECNLSLIDLSHDPEFSDPGLFYDELHLNPKGAEVYTAAIAREFLKLTPRN